MKELLKPTDLIKTEILERIRELYQLPLPELIFQAQSVHRQFHRPDEIQFCTLASIKTGLCPEDCAYCPQSAHHQSAVKSHTLMSKEEVLQAAQAAKDNGSTRFCMGAAWRNLPEREFENIVELIQSVASVGLEVCCTLGMLSADQAQRLAAAGLHTYNHNIDTSPEYYSQIISTRRYEERLETLYNVQNAGIQVCCGGILGMGESNEDRFRFLAVLASLEPQPDSVPLNALVPVAGTPLEKQPPLDPLELVKMVAMARITIPKAKVRLSAGRVSLSEEAQALCFVAGANSIHTGEKLLTTTNHGLDRDRALLAKLNMVIQREGDL